MRRGMSIGLVAGGLAVAALVGTVSAAPTVGAQSVTPVAPRQSFFGLVNGTHPTAVIKVFCPGPIRVGQTGHPVGGQTLGVRLGPASTAVDSGFTGSLGRAIVVTFVSPVTTPPTTNTPITFRTYGTQPLPTSLVTPCAGRLPVVFSPVPTSKTARSATVEVTYENIAVSLLT
jgi:hypothetical protein